LDYSASTARCEKDVERIASAIPRAKLSRTRVPEDPINVLLVHSDESYCRRLADELAKRGFAVQGFANRRRLLSALDDGIDADVIAAVVNDSSMMLGAEFLAGLDRCGVDLPVILLSDRQALTVVCCGLN
jgi:FixJ family two-component response regulator